MQSSAKAKLKRSWVASETSNAPCEQDKCRKQNTVGKGGSLTISQSSDVDAVSDVSPGTNRPKETRVAEEADTVKRTTPVVGLAERRLLRLKKSLEKQRNQTLGKISKLSTSSVKEKRSQTLTVRDNVPGRSNISSTKDITARGTEKCSAVEGLNCKKNIAAKRLKALHDILNKQQKRVPRGNQNSDEQPNKPICVVVQDSCRNVDEAEFVEAEEKMLMDVQELREEIHKAGGVNPEEIEEMICEIIPSSFPDTKSKLYIVSDTNVLVSNFQSLEKLCGTDVEGVGYPVFIIPWMVLHELDILKDRRDVTKSKLTAVRAQKAIKFLHDCFSSKHPRVIGQTVSDAGPEALTGLCNPDNSILQCCLQQVKLGRKVLLLSDDKNLQNKCMVNGIDAVGKRGLKNYLESLSKQTKKEVNAVKSYSSGSAVSTFEQHRVKVDTLITNLKHCAKEVLSKIIVHEMKNAYGDRWLDIICVKPPFSLDNIFTCLTQHWIAVFGLVMNKNSLDTVTELKKFCEAHRESGKGSAEILEDVKNITIRLVRLLTDMAKPVYSTLIKEAQSYLEDLITDCENPFSCSALKDTVTFSEPSSEWIVSKHMAVVESIRKIWLALVEFCQQLRTLMAHEHSFLQIGPPVSLCEDDLKTWVSHFYGPVSNLYLIMESVTGTKEGEFVHTAEMQSVMSQMYKDFCELYGLISSGEHIGFSVEDLISFCEDCDTCDVFGEIKEHFHNFGVIMRQAVNYFSSKDLLSFTNNDANNTSLSNDVEMEEG